MVDEPADNILVGEGIVFIEIDGSSKEFVLGQGQQLTLSTGYLVSMDETCQIDVSQFQATVKHIPHVCY